MDLSHALEVLSWHTKESTVTAYLGPVEIRPVPRRMTDSERMAWQREFCNGWYYVKPTKTVSGHYVVTDSMGQETKENNLDDAIEMAAEKLRRANGE